MALNSVQAILQAFANRTQDAEDVAWSIEAALSDPTFASITGDLLDKVGSRIEPRNGRSDADYQAAIRIRVRVNRSRGKAEDVIAVAKLAALNSVPVYTEPNDDGPVFQVDIANLPGAAQVATLLGQAKPVGVRGTLVYSVDTSTVKLWGDAAQPSPLTAANMWGDAVSLTGPLWPSGVGLTA